MVLKMQEFPKIKKYVWFSFLGGVATALGATVGFALVIWIVTFVLAQLGGLPLVGQFFANIVDATTSALQSKR